MKIIGIDPAYGSDETVLVWGSTRYTYRWLFWNFIYCDGGMIPFKSGRKLFLRIWYVPNLKSEWRKRAEETKQCFVRDQEIQARSGKAWEDLVQAHKPQYDFPMIDSHIKAPKG